jgi:glycosyltransferase involved in cell wall biosynthesis
MDLSVIIPAWNRADTIGAALDSVFAQDWRPGGGEMEVIVVDDCSTDDLPAVIGKYDGKVRLVRHQRNLGAAAARNSGIAAARGRLLAFLDSEDVWLPGKLSTQLRFMTESQVSASCTAYLLSVPGRSDFVSPRFKSAVVTIADAVWGCYISPGSTLICERARFEDVGLLDTAFKRLEDWDWLLRFCEAGHVMGFCAEPLARIHMSGGPHAKAIAEAAAHIWGKQSPKGSGHVRRHLRAAVAFEEAAAEHRNGQRIRAALALARSLVWSPFRHRAFAMVLHNKLGRR